MRHPFAMSAEAISSSVMSSPSGYSVFTPRFAHRLFGALEYPFDRAGAWLVFVFPLFGRGLQFLGQSEPDESQPRHEVVVGRIRERQDLRARVLPPRCELREVHHLHRHAALDRARDAD